MKLKLAAVSYELSNVPQNVESDIQRFVECSQSIGRGIHQ